jgi:hypothetical protein
MATDAMADQGPNLSEAENEPATCRRADDLVLVTTEAMRARRHPWALVGLWAWQTGLAVAASWPAASLVDATFRASPRGDAPLWDAGGHALLDFLWHGARGLAPVTAAAEFALVIGAVAGLWPTAAAMIAMAHVARDRRPAGFVHSMAAGLKTMPSLLVLWVTVSVAQVVAVGIGAGAGGAVDAWTHAWLGEARASRMGVAVGLMFVVVASGLGVVHDLARAAVVCSRASGLGALALGAKAFGQAPLPLWWSWAWRALVSLAPVLAAAAVAARIGGRGGGTLVLLALLHQGVVLSRVALHGSWLAQALRSVDRVI